MANYWTAPKTNWADTDGIGYEDFNRIEQNSSAVRDGTKRGIQGFGYTLDNSNPAYDGLLTVNPGSCYSENGVPIRADGFFTKNLNAWSQGQGPTFGCMAPTVVPAAHTWYYIFIIFNPVDGTYEYMVDNNRAGSNVASLVYTEKRYINCFKTAAAGTHGSFYTLQMYSTGDRVYINPNALYDINTVILQASLPVNEYDLEDIKILSSPSLPAIRVQAWFNIFTENVTWVGLVSSAGIFTIPSPFIVSSRPRGDWVGRGITTGNNSLDAEILVGTGSNIYIAMTGGVSPFVEIRVRGFYDERLP